MLVYIAFFIFLAFLAIEYEYRPFLNPTWLILVIILLGLFAGLRGPEVSRDYGSYHRIFDYIYELTEIKSASVFPVIEPGFTFIVIIFRSILQSNYVIPLMLFFAFTSIAIKFFYFKEFWPNPYLVVLFYFSQFFLLHEMTQIRIAFATAFFFIALVFYFREQRWIYAGIIVFASLFHYSAIIYLILLLFDRKRFSKTIYIAILSFAVVLGYLKIPFLNFLGLLETGSISGKLAHYAILVESGYAEKLNFFNAGNLLNMLVCLYLILVIPKHVLIENRKLLLFLKCNILSIFILALLSGIPSFAYRFSEIFGLLSIFTYASLAQFLPFKKYDILITVCIAFFVFYITVIHSELLGPYYITPFK